MKFEFDFPAADSNVMEGYQYVEAIIFVKFITVDGNIGWFRSRTEGINIWESIGQLTVALRQETDHASYDMTLDEEGSDGEST